MQSFSLNKEGAKKGRNTEGEDVKTRLSEVSCC